MPVPPKNITVTFDTRPRRTRWKKRVTVGVLFLAVLAPSPFRALPHSNPICRFTPSC
jgi:hypothetical protein